MMKIQKPLANLARIFGKSHQASQINPQNKDTFWNVLQNSAKRLAGNIASSKYTTAQTPVRESRIHAQNTAATKQASTAQSSSAVVKPRVQSESSSAYIVSDAEMRSATANEKREATAGLNAAQPQVAAVPLPPVKKFVSADKVGTSRTALVEVDGTVHTSARSTHMLQNRITTAANHEPAGAAQVSHSIPKNTTENALKVSGNSVAISETPQMVAAAKAASPKTINSALPKTSAAKTETRASITLSASENKAYNVNTNTPQNVVAESPKTNFRQQNTVSTTIASETKKHPDPTAIVTKEGHSKQTAVHETIAGTANKPARNPVSDKKDSRNYTPTSIHETLRKSNNKDIEENSRHTSASIQKRASTSNDTVQASTRQSTMKRLRDVVDSDINQHASEKSIAQNPGSHTAVNKSDSHSETIAKTSLSLKSSGNPGEIESAVTKIGRYWRSKLHSVQQLLTGKQTEQNAPSSAVQTEINPEARVSQIRNTFRKLESQNAPQSGGAGQKAEDASSVIKKVVNNELPPTSASSIALKPKTELSQQTSNKPADVVVRTQEKTSVKPVEPTDQIKAQTKQTAEVTRPPAKASQENINTIKTETQASTTAVNAVPPKTAQSSESPVSEQRSFWGMKVFARFSGPTAEKNNASPLNLPGQHEVEKTVPTKPPTEKRIIQSETVSGNKSHSADNTLPVTGKEMKANEALKPQPAETDLSIPKTPEKTEKTTRAADFVNRTFSDKQQIEKRSESLIPGRETLKKPDVAPVVSQANSELFPKSQNVFAGKPSTPSSKMPRENTINTILEAKPGMPEINTSIKPDAPLSRTPIVFQAAPLEQKDAEQAVPRQRQTDDKKNESTVPSTVIEKTNPRKQVSVAVLPERKTASTVSEKRAQTPIAADALNRTSNTPTMTEMPNIRAEYASNRVEPSFAGAVSNTRTGESAVQAKRSGETVSDSSASKTIAAETTASQPTTRTDGEAPAANSNTPAMVRESVTRIETAMPSQRTRITVEQIRELQALTSRAMQTAQTMMDGSSQATFQWAPDGFGPLRFNIVTRNDDVRIEINTGRMDVIEALEEGRGNIERMIADLGMRMEKFEVRLRTPDMPDPLSQPSQDQAYPERNTHRPQEKAASASGQMIQEAVEEKVIESRRSLAEHEWVA